jgi:hypothetical protein
VHAGAEQKAAAAHCASAAQFDPQVAVAQAYDPHDVVWSGAQFPAPSQLAASVAVPLVQLALRHSVVAGGNVHAVRSVPSQLPPHWLPSLVHAVRVPFRIP